MNDRFSTPVSPEKSVGSVITTNSKNSKDWRRYYILAGFLVIVTRLEVLQYRSHSLLQSSSGTEAQL